MPVLEWVKKKTIILKQNSKNSNIQKTKKANVRQLINLQSYS